MSAKKIMLDLLLKNVGKIVTRDKMQSLTKVHDWMRSLRSLRQEGWDIESLKDGYVLHSKIKKESQKKRESINNKLRYAVFHRDNSICQRCGKTPKDGIKLEADHKIPVEWGGTNDLDNLWTLCSSCNGGKKDLFSDFDEKTMAIVLKEKNGYKKIIKYFELNPNKIIEPYIFDIISGIRDWERTLRLIRAKEKMDIKWIPKSKKNINGGYIYKNNK